MTTSHNVTRRHKSSSSVHPSPDGGHGIGRGLPNDSEASTGHIGTF